MELKIKNLIESTLDDLAINKPIESFVLKLQMITKKLKNEDFSLWIKKEMNGYGDADVLPAYRIVNTRVVANLIIDNGIKVATLRHHEMPLYQIKSDEATKMSKVHIKESVVSISNLLKESREGDLGYSVTEYEKYLLRSIYSNSNILSAYKPISRSEFEFIIHKFKSIILDTFMDLNENVFNEEIDFDIMSKKTEIERIVNQTINAGVVNTGHGTIQIDNSTAVGGMNNKVILSDTDKKEVGQLVDRLDELTRNIEDDRDDVAEELVRIHEELNNKISNPKILRSALNAIKGVSINVDVLNITQKILDCLPK